jgi:AcrR family transcriptional regulator
MPVALDPDRRFRILDAATVLFSSYGFRRTSMDALAREAQVAKPTLYAYFADKEAVFIAVVDRVMTAILEDARAAAAADGTLEDRLVGILEAKFLRIFELVHRSPHAADLLSSSDAQARDLVEQADTAFQACLTSALASAIRAGIIDPARARVSRGDVVRALMQAGYGADALATTPADHRSLVRTNVRILLLALN